MTPRPVHLDGPDTADVAWSADPVEDGFDWEGMESAMLEARREAYRSLRDLDAA